MMYDRNGFIRNMESGEEKSGPWCDVEGSKYQEPDELAKIAGDTGIVRAGKSWDESELVREFEENRRKVRSTHPYIYANEDVEGDPVKLTFSSAAVQDFMEWQKNWLRETRAFNETMRQKSNTTATEKPTQAEKCGRGEHEADKVLNAAVDGTPVIVCRHCRVLYVAK